MPPSTTLWAVVGSQAIPEPGSGPVHPHSLLQEEGRATLAMDTVLAGRLQRPAFTERARPVPAALPLGKTCGFTVSHPSGLGSCTSVLR